MTEPAAQSGMAKLDAIAEILADELAALLEAAEAVLAELEAVEALRASGDGHEAFVGRAVRRDAMAARTEAIGASTRAADARARARELGEACDEQLDDARRFLP